MFWELEDRLSSVCIVICSRLVISVSRQLWISTNASLSSFIIDDDPFWKALMQTTLKQKYINCVCLEYKWNSKMKLMITLRLMFCRQQRESQTMKIIKRFQRCGGFICNHLWKCRVSYNLKMMLVRQTVNILLPINYRNKTRHKYNYPLWILIYLNLKLKYWVLACLANLSL